MRNMVKSRMLKIWMAAASLALTLLGAAPGHAADKASYRNDWALSGYQLPVYWAKGKGYYEAEGIDLEIKDGAGSAKSVNLISAKEDTFGLADALVTADFVAKGVPVKSIYVIVENGGSAIVSWADKPLKTPQDLIGHSLAAIADQKPTLDQFLAINKVPADQVTLRIVAIAARNTVFYQGQVDGIVSSLIGSPMDMVVAARKGTGKPVHLMPYSDFGIVSLGQGLIAHDETIAKSPDLVRRFVRATAKGAIEAAKPENWDEATDIAMALSKAPDTRRDSVKLQWSESIPRQHSAHTAGKPLGWTSDADWQECMDLLVKTDPNLKPVPVTQIYTNQFVPE